MVKVLLIGGRVKAASIGLDRFFGGQTAIELDRTISMLRRHPCEHLRKAFFPRTENDLRHMTSGIGLYRPSLKTDQGMPGNFLPFFIDPGINVTDFRVRSIVRDEGVVIPEAWFEHSPELVSDVQAAFLNFDLSATLEILRQLESRRADKGRMPFMLIRPAMTDSPIVFGTDVVNAVEERVRCIVDQCVKRAQAMETLATGTARPSNLTYLQPDVYVLTDGSITVERINCPDVGFFLADLDAGESRALPPIQKIVRSISDAVADRIVEKMGLKIVLVTRDSVLRLREDVLEIREIACIKSMLQDRDVTVEVISASQVDSIAEGGKLLLLNLDYSLDEVTTLLRRHAMGEVECYPNPYFQLACSQATGMKQVELRCGTRHHKLLLERCRSQPATEAGTIEALRLIDKSLTQCGVEGEVLHVVLETETVPVLRRSLHSWRQLATRAQRPKNENRPIRFRSVPADQGTLLLTSPTGPRLHAFRFMCIA